MEIITIRARIKDNKKSEFFQTMEALKTLVNHYCNDLEILNEDNNVIIRITFNGREERERVFYNNEFNILKSTLRNLCGNYGIKINEGILRQKV